MSDEPYVISQQGAIVVNGGECIHSCDDVALVILHLESKYPEVIGYGASYSSQPCVADVSIGASDRTLYTHPTAERDSITEVAFPMFAGYEVFAISRGKYRIKVCLLRDESDDKP